MSSTTKAYSSDAYQSPTATLKNISSHRSSFPQYSDHVARYYQRISDIFETNESDQTSDKFNVVKRRQSVLKSKESVPVKTTYKTVLEDVKDLEQKYRRMNEDEERRRPRTDLDHYRPDVVLYNTNTPHQFKKLSSQETEQGIRGSSYDKLYSRTLQLYRDAATPPSPSSNKNMSTSKTSSSSITITPARYLAANLKTDLYSHRQSRYQILLVQSLYFISLHLYDTVKQHQHQAVCLRSPLMTKHYKIEMTRVWMYLVVWREGTPTERTGWRDSCWSTSRQSRSGHPTSTDLLFWEFSNDCMFK